MEHVSFFMILLILGVAANTLNVRCGQIKFLEGNLLLILVMIMLHLEKVIFGHGSSFENRNSRGIL